RGVAAVGWPPLRWLSKLRPDPLRRLGLGRPSGGQASGRPSGGQASGGGSGDSVLRRTSIPAGSAISRAGVDTAVRQLADVASARLPEPWPAQLRSAARLRIEEVPDALDRAVGGADLGMQVPPRWWRAAGIAQWTLLAVAVCGLAWLGLLAGLAYVQIDLEPPKLGSFAWPTVLLFGGLLGGLALRVLARPFIAVGAARRRRRAERELSGRVGAVAEQLILVPARAELNVLVELGTAVRRLAN
ncbi:MAG: ABC transporter, partial [Actinomycetota bacterium]|nr:ABC transporter [Actinomycetota bacterium]